MRVAVLSDVHGNLPALEAVLERVDECDVDHIICCGDVIGYGPWPDECVSQIREVADMTVRGNHDRTLTNDEINRYKGQNHMAYAGLAHAKENVSEDNMEWLASLPPTNELGDLMVVHSHPEEEDKYVFPRDFPRMRPFMEDFGVMVLGHTHIQHKAAIDGRLIVNPGSVGQPRDKDPDAAFAVVDVENREVEFERVEYDIKAIEEKCKEVGLPDDTYARLYLGE